MLHDNVKTVQKDNAANSLLSSSLGVTHDVAHLPLLDLDLNLK